MMPIPEDHVLRRMFRGMVEHAFCAEIGICDPALTEYVTDLLVNFAHVDSLYALRDTKGKQLQQIADMLGCGRTGNDGPGYELVRHRHIGDFALFWTGVYPEHARRDRGLAGKDRLLDYVTQGKRSYSIAARLADEDNSPPGSLLGRLSEDFECCCHGLGLVRRGWDQGDPQSRSRSSELLY